jgi:uncharacterized integral membrane protein
MSFIRGAILVAITAALTLFTVQNLAPFEVRFAVWSLQAPGAVVVIGIFALGAVFGFLANLLRPSPPRGVNTP